MQQRQQKANEKNIIQYYYILWCISLTIHIYSGTISKDMLRVAYALISI